MTVRGAPALIFTVTVFSVELIVAPVTTFQPGSPPWRRSTSVLEATALARFATRQRTTASRMRMGAPEDAAALGRGLDEGDLLLGSVVGGDGQGLVQLVDLVGGH